MNLELIEKEITNGYINRQRHPTAPLSILNYSARTQFEWRWNDETMACRGLIVDDEGNIVARPFRKFFSYEQLEGKVPDGEFEVYDKLDGSLGVLYWAHGEPRIATRGSFISEQAVKGTQMLATKYVNSLPLLDPSLTYLFEIIYPKNRIVVDYGEEESLVLLAIVETETGIERPLMDIGFPTVKRFDGIKDVTQISAMDTPNSEGFVARFQCGTRVKFKFAEYKRLHKLLTGINPRHIWESLSKGDDLSSIVEKVPDEFFAWVKAVQSQLLARFAEIEAKAKAQFKNLGDRKKTAEYFKTCDYPSILFTMLDDRDHAPQIWKLIRPEVGAAFRCDIDL